MTPEAEEVYSGGFPEVYKYRPRVRFRFKDKEDRQAAKIAEQIAEVHPIDTTDDELELALRLRLQHNELKYKNIYLRAMVTEFHRIAKLRKRKLEYLQKRKKRMRQEEELIISLYLH